MKNANWIRIAFIFIAVLTSVWVINAWLNPTRKNHYNPSETYSSQQGTNTVFVPPPNVDLETGQTKVTTEKEIERWRASRSDLAAQWKVADMSQLAFRISVLGVILLTWTIIETLRAGKQLKDQNLIALKATKAEFQPYINFPDQIRASLIYNDIGNGNYSVFSVIKITDISNQGKTCG